MGKKITKVCGACDEEGHQWTDHFPLAMNKNTGDGELDNAAAKTAHYLYDIEGECSPELYQAIATLRQLINEEFKPAKSLSSQFIYDIINPAIAQEANKAIIRFLENSDNVSRDELLADLKKEKESSE